MKYEMKSGIKEYCAIWLAIIVIWLLADFVRYSLPDMPLAADGTFVVLCGVLVSFVYTRYCAHFTYTLADDALVIERKIGRRSVKSRNIQYCTIGAVSNKKPKGRAAFSENYTKKIAGGRSCRYIISKSGEYLVKISAGEEFINKLKELANA